MLLFQQGIKHVQFAVARVSFRVACNTCTDPAAGQVGEVLKQRKAAGVRPGSFTRITTDDEHLVDAGVVEIVDKTSQLLPALDASCGQVRYNLEAKVGKLDSRPDRGTHTLMGQARHRQNRPCRCAALDQGDNALSRSYLQPDRENVLLFRTRGPPFRGA